MIENSNIIELLSADKLNYDQISNYLTKLNLPPNSPEKLTEVWNLKSTSDESIFDLVCKKNDKKLIEILLDFDYPVPSQYSTIGMSEDIIAILHSRGNWQKKVQEGESGISFNRTLSLIQHTMQEIKSQADAGILVMGETGAGKSTLTNFMSGINYVKDGPDLHKEKDDNIEIAKVGEQTSSETLFPTGYKLKNLTQNVLWIDMPGTQDTGGHIREIAAAIGTDIITSHVKNIQGILLVVPWSKLEDPRLTAYRDVAEKIGRILDAKDETLLKRVVLVVTKPIDKLAVKHVSDRLKKLWDNELKDLKLTGSNLDPEYSRKLVIRRTTAALLDELIKVENDTKNTISTVDGKTLTSHTNIIITDVTNPMHREDLNKIIASFPSAVSHNAFNFKDYHLQVDRFKDKIMYFNERYLSLFEDVKKNDHELKELQQAIDSVTKRLEKHKISCNAWKAKKDKLQIGADIDERIAQNLKLKDFLTEEINSNSKKLETVVNQKKRVIDMRENIDHRISVVQTNAYQASSGFFDLKKNRQNSDELLSVSCSGLINIYEKTFDTVRRLIASKNSQLSLCEKRRIELQEEKIEIEAIKVESGNNIEKHINDEEAAIIQAREELEMTTKVYEEKKKLLANQILTFNINVNFFAKINIFIQKLNWQNIFIADFENMQRTVSAISKEHHNTDIKYSIGQLPTMYSTSDNQAKNNTKSLDLKNTNAHSDYKPVVMP